ncbi:hypothetical protein ONZ45_g4593 [Pleurotus djamor]|nr:hypothetical protein ONZ45_g4593 [Pleurotus djamor]
MFSEAARLTPPGGLSPQYGAVESTGNRSCSKSSPDRDVPHEHCDGYRTQSIPPHPQSLPSSRPRPCIRLSPSEANLVTMKRQRRMALHDQLNGGDIYSQHYRRTEHKLRPAFKRRKTSDSLIFKFDAEGTSEAPPEEISTPHGDEITLSTLTTPAMELSSYFGRGPFVAFGTSADPPMLMNHQNFYLNANASGGDGYNGSITGSNVGGRENQNDVRNDHRNADQESLQTRPMHFEHTRLRDNVLLMFGAVMMSITGLVFFVDLDVLLALLKAVNAKAPNP